MSFRDAQIVGRLAFIGPDGVPAHLPHGQCKLRVSHRVVTVQWGDSPEESTSFPIHLLDEFVSGGAIVCSE